MQPHRRQFFTIALLTSLWAGIQPASGQYTSNYQTNTISGATSNWAGDYVVGSNTFANALLIRNAGVLTNADGYVGYLPASSSNYVLIAGAKSVWTNANLYLGFSGGGNSLVISNAGVVADNLGTYVAYNATSSSNHVLVTGTNSVWNCAYFLELGYAGPGNSLVISNGGQVLNTYSELGNNVTGPGNSVLITGTNSIWNNSWSCTIGRTGGNNKLTINKGGHLVSNGATLGTWDSASSNSIVVSDSGSLWDDSAVASEINFGLNGSGYNSLIVTNGAQVLGYYAYLGRNPSSYNSVLVTGPGSSFSVNCYIFTGNQGHDNTFTLANGAAVSDKFCYISYVAGSSNNAVLITGTNSSWQNSYSVFVGFDGVDGNLTISNGATMGVTQDGVLGQDSTSSNNRALVTGKGSVWSCSRNLYVGYVGPANNLVIGNGGWVINDYGLLGTQPGSDSNSVTVTGSGSVWTNYDDVYVGYSSVANSLTITNGGRVINNYGLIGYAASSSSNQVLVTGTNSLWTNSSYVYVGNDGLGNSLVISNGGRVTDDVGLIGQDTNSFNNQVLVTGAGSVWSNTTAVFVGYYGPSNNLVISSGGLVADGWGLIGEADSTSSDNTVWVGPGGVWRNQQLVVGDLGSENTLFVEGGSVFVTTNMVVGFNSFYCDNLVQLDSGQITVTNQTHDAVLEVYDGTFVLNGGTLRVDTLIVTNDCAQFLHVGGTLIYRSLQLNPNQSAVGDGIPNLWKQQYGFDPLDPNVAGADPDHDGANNLQEYLAGTNPTNAASVFHIISAAKTNLNVRVTWSTVGGHHYVLQTNDALGAGTFADFGPVISVGGANEGTTNSLDPGAATNHSSRFYRIRLAQ